MCRKIGERRSLSDHAHGLARYELGFKTPVAKDLRGIAKAEGKRLLARIDGLGSNLRPPAADKRSGHALYRVRQGPYRIVYRMAPAERVVDMIAVATAAMFAATCDVGQW